MLQHEICGAHENLKKEKKKKKILLIELLATLTFRATNPLVCALCLMFFLCVPFRPELGGGTLIRQRLETWVNTSATDVSLPRPMMNSMNGHNGTHTMRHLIGSLDGHVAGRSCKFSPTNFFSIGCHDRSVTRGLWLSIFSLCSSIPFEREFFKMAARWCVQRMNYRPTN